MSWKAFNALACLISILAVLPAAANIQRYPEGFRMQEIDANGTTLQPSQRHRRHAGQAACRTRRYRRT
jgi:hypothetical protein